MRFFSTAAEAVVHVALCEGDVHLEHLHALGENVGEVEQVELLTLGQVGLHGGAEEVGDGDPWDPDRVLEGEEETGQGALVGLQLEEVLTAERDGAARGLVPRVSREHFR